MNVQTIYQKRMMLHIPLLCQPFKSPPGQDNELVTERGNHDHVLHKQYHSKHKDPNMCAVFDHWKQQCTAQCHQGEVKDNHHLRPSQIADPSMLTNKKHKHAEK